MTAPTSRQLHLALGLIAPAWGSNNWPVLGFIAANTVDLHGQEWLLEASEATIAKRLGKGKTAVGDCLDRLIEQRVLQVFRACGRRARCLRIEGDFSRWRVPWRIDRSKALHVLNDAVVTGLYGGSQRVVCDRFYGGSQRSDEEPADQLVYRISGDFVPAPRGAYKPPVVAGSRGGSQPAPSDNVSCFSSKSSLLGDDEGDLSPKEEAVVAALSAATGQGRWWGKELADVRDAIAPLDDVALVIGALRRVAPVPWWEGKAVVIHAATEARKAAARIERSATMQEELTEVPIAPDAAARVRNLREELLAGRLKTDEDQEEAL